MATFPVNVTLRLNANQFNQMLGQIGQNAKNAKIQLGGMQSQIASMDRNVLRGAGSFFLMHRAMQAGIGVMKRGVQGAIDFDYALNRLQWAVHGNAKQMKVFERIAQETAIQLGPIAATEVLQGMERLARSTDMTMRGMARLAPEVATVVSNIVELSDKTVTVPQMFTNIQQLITAFGGAGDPKKVMNTLTAFHGIIQSFAAEDPERLFKGMLAAIPTMKGLDLSAEEIMVMAAMRKLQPTRGRNTSGIDLAQMSRIVFGGYLGETGKKMEGRRAALTELGLMENGRPIAQKIGFIPALFRMTQTMEQKKATLGPEQFKDWMQITFGRAFNTQLVGDLGRMLAQNEGTLIQVLDKLSKAWDPKTMSQKILGTSRGTIGQLVESIDTLLTRIYMQPLKGATPFIGGASSVVQHMTRQMGEGGSMQMAALAALLGIPAGMVGITGGAMMTAAGLPLAGAVGAAGGTLLLAGLLGAVIVGGITAYQMSDEFAFAVDQTKNTLVGYFNDAMSWVEEVRNSTRWQAFLSLGRQIRDDFGLSDPNVGAALSGHPKGFTGLPPASESTFDTKGRYMRMRKRHRRKRDAWDEELTQRRLNSLADPMNANPNVGPKMTPGVRQGVSARHMSDAVGMTWAQQLFNARQRGTSSETPSKLVR